MRVPRDFRSLGICFAVSRARFSFLSSPLSLRRSTRTFKLSAIFQAKSIPPAGKPTPLTLAKSNLTGVNAVKESSARSWRDFQKTDLRLSFSFFFFVQSWSSTISPRINSDTVVLLISIAINRYDRRLFKNSPWKFHDFWRRNFGVFWRVKEKLFFYWISLIEVYKDCCNLHISSRWLLNYLIILFN